MNKIDKAKEIFLRYQGSYFQMERDGVLSHYRSYNINQETEKKWIKEYQSELIAQIEAGISIDVHLSHLCSAIRQYKDDEYLNRLTNILSKILASVDTFIQLRIAEELLEIVQYFISNKIGNKENLKSLKDLARDILRNIKSQPIILSEETKRTVIFEDTLEEENIRKRAEQKLNDFK